MKRVLFILAVAAVMGGAAFPLLAAGGGRAGRGAPASSTLTQPRASPHDAINNRIGGDANAMVTIYYGRPYAKGRKIFAKKEEMALVPFGDVWRLGSDEATTMVTQRDLIIGDLVVPAGAYTLCMLPMENGNSKLIINKQIGQWGIPYSPAIEKNELGRVDLKKEADVDPAVDQLTLAFSNATGGSTLKITWEKSQWSILFKVKS